MELHALRKDLKTRKFEEDVVIIKITDMNGVAMTVLL
jgi:hypothetical protein